MKEREKVEGCSLVDFCQDVRQHQMGRKIDCCQEQTDERRLKNRWDPLTYRQMHALQPTYRKQEYFPIKHLDSIAFLFFTQLHFKIKSLEHTQHSCKHFIPLKLLYCRLPCLVFRERFSLKMSFKPSLYNQYHLHTQGRGMHTHKEEGILAALLVINANIPF